MLRLLNINNLQTEFHPRGQDGFFLNMGDATALHISTIMHLKGEEQGVLETIY